MGRISFYEVESKCDVCELAEKYEPVYSCWTDDQKMEFNIHFKEIDGAGHDHERFADLLVRFEKDGSVRLYASDTYQET